MEGEKDWRMTGVRDQWEVGKGWGCPRWALFSSCSFFCPSWWAACAAPGQWWGSAADPASGAGLPA